MRNTLARLLSASLPLLSMDLLPDLNSKASGRMTYTLPSFSATVRPEDWKPVNASATFARMSFTAASFFSRADCKSFILLSLSESWF